MAGGCIRIYNILVSPWKDAEKEHPAISPCPTHTPPPTRSPAAALSDTASAVGWRRLCAGSLGGEGSSSRCGRNAWPALRAAKRNGPCPLTAADSTHAGQGVCEVPVLRGASKLDKNTSCATRAIPTRLPGCPRDRRISGGDGPGPAKGRCASSSRTRFRACTTVVDEAIRAIRVHRSRSRRWLQNRRAGRAPRVRPCEVSTGSRAIFGPRESGAFSPRSSRRSSVSRETWRACAAYYEPVSAAQSRQ